MYKRILVPIERDGDGDAYLQHAGDLAASVGAEVILLGVISVVAAEDYFLQQIQVEEGSRGAHRKVEAEARVAQLGEILTGRGLAVEPVVVVSDKAEDEAIVEYASQAGCDLIVLPNQRRSLVSRWLQGNVPARVQRRTQVPILLIKDKD